jgi:hypothetical protein
MPNYINNSSLKELLILMTFKLLILKDLSEEVNKFLYFYQLHILTNLLHIIFKLVLFLMVLI